MLRDWNIRKQSDLKMAGNEKDIAKLLVEHKNKLYFDHIGHVNEISTPIKSGFRVLESDTDIELYLKPDSKYKKADIYINQIGISLKQTGGSKAFNKFYRKDAKDFFEILDYEAIDEKIEAIDHAVKLFHNGEVNRNYPWQKIFSEEEFKKMMCHLMMKGTPHSVSDFPADYIMTAPKEPTLEMLTFYNLDEYFDAKKDITSIAIRRCWTHQESKTESNRAMKIATVHEDSEPWVFDTVSGKPRKGEFTDNPIKKTCYYLDLEVKD